ncbi:MAG: LacI family DNA-binding transcriptional regulator [Anaerolineales bacterium]|nr:LacI family DNA-binding transcriptional regulator [Anaerolineales bacterium]MCW5854636.1 LacI family DNA-binding transcriptional regulator [Anaerolineales bacterium]
MSTIEEIAKKAGVSRSTVSRVINNDPNVNEQTRERVLQVVTSNNYVPNRAARKLAGGRTGIIGLVIPTGVSRLFVEPFFPILIQSVTNHCNRLNRSVMFWLGEPEHERRSITQILSNDLLDGVIVSSLKDRDPIVEALHNSQVPFVLIGRYRENLPINFVDIDNEKCTQMAVNYLIQIGRRRIATITGVSDTMVSRERLDGYRATLAKAGLPVDENLIAEGGFVEEGGYAAMAKIFPHKPDAVFATSDAMAVGAIRFLKEQGVRVPQDVAVVGFDDVPLAASYKPALTTIAQPIEELGQHAVDMLITLIEQRPKELLTEVLPSNLIIRESA